MPCRAPCVVDLTFILDRRLAVGGGIWTAPEMAELARLGFTHIVNLQIEFDDSELAAPFGLQVLWIPTDDDLAPKPPHLFERAVRFVLEAWEQPSARFYIHCAAGMHRSPLAAAAVLCALGFDLDDAVALIASRRIGAAFPEPYLESLRAWWAGRGQASTHAGSPAR